MAELTREELRSEVTSAMRGVLSDHELMERAFQPLVSRLVIEKMAEKLDRTFGVDCMDHEAREEVRRDMEWLREERIWSRSEEGQATRASFRKLMKAIDFVASGTVRGLLFFALAGVATLVIVGLATHEGIKKAVDALMPR